MDALAAEPAASDAAPSDLLGPEPHQRTGTSTVVWVGLFLFFAYFMSVRFLEQTLDREIQKRIDRAIVVTDFDRPVAQQIKERIDAAVRDSKWVRWGGLRVTTLVLAQDGVTWLYVEGHGSSLSPPGLRPDDILTEWVDYLPATAEVTVSLPYTSLLSNGLLLGYAAMLLPFVYTTNRRRSGEERRRLNDALATRDRAALRTEQIELELAATRSRLSQIEPMEREQSEEIEVLQREREMLQHKLSNLAAREETLRGRAARAVDLAQEVRALEDLLEEATGDLDSKDGEIGRLEQSLKKAARSSDKAASSKTKAADLIARRFRTLYKTIEIDDRAIDDIASLGDESLRLKAEEVVKRLAEEADNVSVRRKVGGLPAYVNVFEMGFAGKGRIYYSRGKSKRFRILLVGAKNTQSSDLEFLSRLPKSLFG